MNQQEKTALLNEVMELVHEEISSSRQGMSIFLPLNNLLRKLGYMLPKEEAIPDRQIKEPIIHEVKSEPTQEIKVGQYVWLSKYGGFTHTVLFIKGDDAWIRRNHDGENLIVKVNQIYNDIESEPLQKTQEEMDEEEIYNLICEIFGTDEVLYGTEQRRLYFALINYGRKTKQV